MGWLEDLANFGREAGKVAGGIVETAGSYLANEAKMVAEGYQAVSKAISDTEEKWVETTFPAPSPVNTALQGAIDVSETMTSWFSFGISVAAEALEFGAEMTADMLRGEMSLENLGEHWNEFVGDVETQFDELQNEASEFVLGEPVVLEVPMASQEKKFLGDFDAQMFSVCASGVPNQNFSDSGQRFEFRLDAGVVRYRSEASSDPNSQFEVLAPDPKTAPIPGGVVPEELIGTPIAVRYVTSRKPEIFAAPQFESIVANGDRVFAKVDGKNEYYFCLISEMFAPDGKLPSYFFKLDPELNQVHAKSTDLTDHLQAFVDAQKNLISPVGERLPVMVQAAKDGLLESLIVPIVPKYWYHIDSRPPFTAVDIPEGEQEKVDFEKEYVPDDSDSMPEAEKKIRFRRLSAVERFHPERMPYNTPESALDAAPKQKIPLYEQSVFVPGGDWRKYVLPKMVRNSIKYSQVQSLGIGNLHYYESWSAENGGEISVLQSEHMYNSPILSYIYAFFNGPIMDGDGFCDGTCNFYKLVKFDEGSFGILFIDEQTFFSHRWRLLDPRDYKPTLRDFAIKRLNFNFSLTAGMHLTWLKDAFRFDREYFWDPFTDNHITEDSRMAVAKQIIAVTGRDPKTNRQELYTINYSWGSMDRTWRFRTLPGEKVFQTQGEFVGSSKKNPGLKSGSFAQSVHIRDDLTISVAGFQTDQSGNRQMGYWVQKYLPADCEHVPTKEFLRKNKKPAQGYEHKWQFWPKAAFEAMNRYSHFGVYPADGQPVSSRSQYYVLEIPNEDMQAAAQEGLVWKELDDTLYIKARKFSWFQLAYETTAEFNIHKFFAEDLPMIMNNATSVDKSFQIVERYSNVWERKRTAEKGNPYHAQGRTSRTSQYHDGAEFRILDRGDLGLIAIWNDKRDDDLLPISDLPMSARFEASGRKITLKLRERRRVTHPPQVERVTARIDGDQVKVTIESGIPAADRAENIWKIHFGALDLNTSERIFAKDILWSKAREARPGVFEANFAVSPSDQKFFSAGASENFAMSIWFEGALGHVACAEETIIGGA